MMATESSLGLHPIRVLSSGCPAEESDVRSHSSAQAEPEAIPQEICDTRAWSCITEGICSCWRSVHGASNRRPESRYMAIRGMSADATFCPMQEKCTLAFKSILMLIIWPASLLLGLIDMVQHTVCEEPLDYRAVKSAGGGISVVSSIGLLGYFTSVCCRCEVLECLPCCVADVAAVSAMTSTSLPWHFHVHS